MRMISSVLLVAVLAACDDGTGSYLGTATEVSGGTTEENNVILYVDTGAESGVDAVLDGSELPCSPIALKKSGTRFEQKSDLECEDNSSSTTGTGTPTTSTSRVVMKDFEVKLSDGTLKVTGIWESSSGTGTQVTTTDYEFDGERMGK